MHTFTICNRTNSILSITGIGELRPYITVTKQLEDVPSTEMLPTLHKLEKAGVIEYRIVTDTMKESVVTEPPTLGYKITNMYVDENGKVILEFENFA